MLAIYQRELKGYFTSMIGYAFCAFLLFVEGLFFTSTNLFNSIPYFGYSLINVVLVFLIIVPLLTMRSWSEEQSSKTEQLIFSAPISVGKVVWGKFLAMVSVFAIAVLIMAIYPLVLDTMGETSMVMAYTSLLAFFLVGCAFIAIGMFISSLTESPVLAAIITFVVLFADYMSSGMASVFTDEALGAFIGVVIMIFALGLVFYMLTKNVTASAVVIAILEMVAIAVFVIKKNLYVGVIQTVFSSLDICLRMNDFINGVFSTANLVYLVSVILLFVFLTVQSVQKRRWS